MTVRQCVATTRSNRALVPFGCSQTKQHVDRRHVHYCVHVVGLRDSRAAMRCGKNLCHTHIIECYPSPRV